MNKSYTLSIDESGQSNPKSYKQSPFFILSGCVIESNQVDDFKEHLNQVKFATWKERWKQVRLRSWDIGEGKGLFRKLYNFGEDHSKEPNQYMTTFCRDLRRFYKRSYFKLFSCCTDKEKAVKTKYVSLKKGRKKMKYIWDQNLIYKLSFQEILENFLCFLVARNATGRITAEASSDQQDIILYKEFFKLQNQGIPHLKITHLEAKQRLTSLSFVTKSNKDLEEEIADSMGYARRLYEETNNGIKIKEELNIYEQMILQAFYNSLLVVPKKRADIKIQKISRRINAIISLPK